MNVNQRDIEAFLLDHAPLKYFWISRRGNCDLRLATVGFLGQDGLGYTIMDDNEDRALACINFLLDQGCPVFDDIDEMDRYIGQL